MRYSTSWLVLRTRSELKVIEANENVPLLAATGVAGRGSEQAANARAASAPASLTSSLRSGTGVPMENGSSYLAAAESTRTSMRRLASRAAVLVPLETGSPAP